MATTKLRWDFPPQSEMHTVEVMNIRNITTDDPSYLQNLRSMVTRLRPCLFGYNEQGEVDKILYCTRDGRFYVKYPGGWHELIPTTNRVRRGKANKCAKAGGGFDTAYMRHFGGKPCYRLIAYAWCRWPLAAKTDPEWYKSGHGFECDHLNGDHSDSNPENLRWITTAENRKWDQRCGREKHKDGAQKGKTLRGIGLEPKRIFYSTLRAISYLSDLQFETFLEVVQDKFRNDTRELTIHNMNDDIRSAIDRVIDHTTYCSRCGCELIEGISDVYYPKKAYNFYRILCNNCYDELFG